MNEIGNVASLDAVPARPALHSDKVIFARPIRKIFDPAASFVETADERTGQANIVHVSETFKRMYGNVQEGWTPELRLKRSIAKDFLSNGAIVEMLGGAMRAGLSLSVMFSFLAKQRKKSRKGDDGGVFFMDGRQNVFFVPYGLPPRKLGAVAFSWVGVRGIGRSSLPPARYGWRVSAFDFFHEGRWARGSAIFSPWRKE